MSQESQEEHAQTSEPEPSLDRPLECTQCSKAIAVRYTEMLGKTEHTVIMCQDCPHLQQRLHGAGDGLQTALKDSPGASLACGSCGTSWDTVRRGQPLGCPECYAVFKQLLLDDLLESHSIPQRLSMKKRSVPAHVGRAPGETAEANPKIRLMALNEALNETLRREDYEQAAWIRDQIKKLSEEEGRDSIQS
jgi:protein arginine kinase activator